MGSRVYLFLTILWVAMSVVWFTRGSMVVGIIWAVAAAAEFFAWLTAKKKGK